MTCSRDAMSTVPADEQYWGRGSGCAASLAVLLHRSCLSLRAHGRTLPALLRHLCLQFSLIN